MIKSKAKNWEPGVIPLWEEPAPEVYPLVNRWQKQKLLKLLDLGCGIGRHSILFAQNDFTVSAFDLSGEGIKKLDGIIDKEGLNITTAVGDMLSLPYSNEYFDSVVAFHAIYHTDDLGIEKVIEEIDRVLKKEGEIFITFNSKGSTAFRDSDNQHLTESTIVKTRGHEAGIPHFYANKEQVEKLLKNFEILEFSYKEEYWPDYTGAHYFVLAKKK